MKELRIVFDGPPSHESGRFVECEDASGRSVNAGKWRKRPDCLWELVVTNLPGDIEIGGKEFVAMVRAKALEEMYKSRYREAVEAEKARLRAHRSLWDRLFPWNITITRKKP